MELVKTQMQISSSKEHQVIKKVKKIIKETGLKGLSRGMSLTICREVPGCGLYFGSYEMLVR